jgi:hypothetical protein
LKSNGFISVDEFPVSSFQFSEKDRGPAEKHTELGAHSEN